ncbi:MAG: hypothetical protein NW237_14945 [Cyanobacteriota bacterium]|nr:hypothetical protein [Cyanobacteriota bacterium]
MGSDLPARPIWRALYLAYGAIDVSYRTEAGKRQHFRHRLAQGEIDKATQTFRRLPRLAWQASQGDAHVVADVIYCDRPLTSLTSMGSGRYWISPDDVRPEWHRYGNKHHYDSVFVLWPQSNLRTGEGIPSGGWGLAIGACDWTGGATYATVANGPEAWWEMPTVGEPWLHEWLHGVAAHYAGQGCLLPDGDADGADRHGYIRSATAGWLPYYQDLMTCQVIEAGQCKGIPRAAWQQAGVRGHRLPVAVDYFDQSRNSFSLLGIFRGGVTWETGSHPALQISGWGEYTQRLGITGEVWIRLHAWIPPRGTLTLILWLKDPDDDPIVWHLPTPQQAGWHTVQLWMDPTSACLYQKLWPDHKNPPDWQRHPTAIRDPWMLSNLRICYHDGLAIAAHEWEAVKLDELIVSQVKLA